VALAGPPFGLHQERTMSRLNGDKARFHKDRKRKMLKRQRIQEMLAKPQKAASEQAASPPAKQVAH
jgi:hypothetical protein